eukprot:NODE_7_length_67686_cov_1.621421.p2 type:complete len:1098 gc:universal NODE_7_length_67686_cov_1.621421:36207-39500(+)
MKQPLEAYFASIQQLILNRQSAVTGLLPASTAINNHGNYQDAWVRDNVYSILCVWGLAIAYEKQDHPHHQHLKYSVIKLMRGLLVSMMKQSHKVEHFKQGQKLQDALHAKYNTNTGDTVVGDHQWGHLQIDATSLFLLILAQMTTYGYQIIYSLDEVDFVQNLVYYIERAYRTPDYGIWERGNKLNLGETELNSSSIGMACAALQAINNVNLFGASGGVKSVIHCLPDEITRNYIILHAALPRESHSKEIDAALLSVIGFPAFAVQDEHLIQKTRQEIVEKLQGNYGLKRFLRDGHQTELEDTRRLHYEPHELQVFENIESEWPLFYTYLILEGLFYQNGTMVQDYMDKIKKCLVTDPEYPYPLLPELFYVPKSLVENEKANPNSQIRQPNENIPLVWAQSLYMLANLIIDKHININDLDPLGRRFLPVLQRKMHSDVVVQISFISEDFNLQHKLNQYGLETQALSQVNLNICDSKALKKAYTALGQNSKLKLSGRPERPMGVLSTSRLYRIKGQTYAFTPSFMDIEEFYLTSDNEFLMSIFENEVQFIKNYWTFTGRPTMVILLTHNMMNLEKYPQSALLKFLINLTTGHCQNTRVHVGRLNELVPTSCVESLDFLADKYSDWESSIKFQNHALKKLNFSEAELNRETVYHATRRAHSKRKSATSIVGLTALTSPLDMQEDLFKSPIGMSLQKLQEPAQFFFEDSPPMQSPPKDELPADRLQFEMGTDTHIKEAILYLVISENIYDQADILQYICSCRPLSFYVEELSSTVHELVEELYEKAMNFRIWNIVRICAGLLRKMVNSLAINITDLLIRQKQITIHYENEYIIHTPLPPDLLKSVVYDTVEDIRQGPLIQEILTSLGTLIRADPKLFSGILRIKTFYIILAMREQVQYTRLCSIDEAIEYLMQMSPYNIHKLLESILSQKQKRVIDHKNKTSITVDVKSGTDAILTINKQNIALELGLNVVAIDRNTGKALEIICFTKEFEELTSLIEMLDQGTIVVMVVKGNVALSPSIHDACKSIGSVFVHQIMEGDGWCMIGEKGATPGTVAEGYQQSGSTPKISRLFDNIHGDGVIYPKNSIMTSGPSHGTINLFR